MSKRANNIIKKDKRIPINRFNPTQMSSIALEHFP